MKEKKEKGKGKGEVERRGEMRDDRERTKRKGNETQI